MKEVWNRDLKFLIWFTNISWLFCVCSDLLNRRFSCDLFDDSIWPWKTFCKEDISMSFKTYYFMVIRPSFLVSLPVDTQFLYVISPALFRLLKVMFFNKTINRNRPKIYGEFDEYTRSTYGFEHTQLVGVVYLYLSILVAACISTDYDLIDLIGKEREDVNLN